MYFQVVYSLLLSDLMLISTDLYAISMWPIVHFRWPSACFHMTLLTISMWPIAMCPASYLAVSYKLLPVHVTYKLVVMWPTIQFISKWPTIHSHMTSSYLTYSSFLSGIVQLEGTYYPSTSELQRIVAVKNSWHISIYCTNSIN